MMECAEFLTACMRDDLNEPVSIGERLRGAIELSRLMNWTDGAGLEPVVIVDDVESVENYVDIVTDMETCGNRVSCAI